MVRTQIQLTLEQSQKLKRIATRKGISVAELIRQSIDIATSGEELTNRDELKKRARSILGKYRDKEGATDVSVNHDKYFADTILNDR